jgi:diamine N-acetyltransferase
MMSMEEKPIVLRLARPDDAGVLRDVAVRTYDETFSSVNTPENMAAYLSNAFAMPRITAELNDPRATFYLAEIDGQVGGYAKLIVRPAPDCVTGAAPIELERLYVDKRWHGKGVASALMDRCLDDAKRAGFKTMYLGVWEHNRRAQAFYAKWNFVRVGEHVFLMGDDAQIDWWMMRTL